MIVFRTIKYKIKSVVSFFVNNFFKILTVLLLCLYFCNKQKSNELIKTFYSKYIIELLLPNSMFCEKVRINGVQYTHYRELQDKINAFCSDNTYTINILKENILLDSWIKDINIQKQFPNTLTINITEYTPFALWFDEDENKLKLIDQFGNIIKIRDNEMPVFQDLLIVKGKDFKSEINSFFNLLSIHYNIAYDLKEIERVGRRRWNLILKNGILIKMPEEDKDIFSVWNTLEKVLSIYGLDVDLLEIDLRIKNKIFLKYKNTTVNEIKKIK